MSTKQLHIELVGLVSEVIGTGDPALLDRTRSVLIALLTGPDGDARE